jgi:hypothetical protein
LRASQRKQREPEHYGETQVAEGSAVDHLANSDFNHMGRNPRTCYFDVCGREKFPPLRPRNLLALARSAPGR